MSKRANLGHLMVDIETLGTGNRAVILSIAAVEFDLATGTTGDYFYDSIDLKSSLDLSREIDADTIQWWFKQSAEARECLFNGTDFLTVLDNFKHYVEAFIADLAMLGKDPQVWCNGINFDFAILKNALSNNTPWPYWSERDVRTIVSLNPSIKEAMPFNGTQHNALHDCYHQIKYCSATYQFLLHNSLF